MEKSEIWSELLKCDTETQSEQMLLEKMAPTDLFDAELLQMFNGKKKKHNLYMYNL